MPSNFPSLMNTTNFLPGSDIETIVTIIDNYWDGSGICRQTSVPGQDPIP